MGESKDMGLALTDLVGTGLRALFLLPGFLSMIFIFILSFLSDLSLDPGEAGIFESISGSLM